MKNAFCFDGSLIGNSAKLLEREGEKERGREKEGEEGGEGEGERERRRKRREEGWEEEHTGDELVLVEFDERIDVDQSVGERMVVLLQQPTSSL